MAQSKRPKSAGGQKAESQDITVSVPRDKAAGAAAGAVVGGVVAGPIGAVVGGVVGSMVAGNTEKIGNAMSSTAKRAARKNPVVKSLQKSVSSAAGKMVRSSGAASKKTIAKSASASSSRSKPQKPAKSSKRQAEP